MMQRHLLSSVALALAAALPTLAAEPPKITPHAEHFFESKVRPVLVSRCFTCHGAEKQESKLRLDSRAAMLKGGEGGRVLQPGKPDDSRIVQVIRYDEFDIQMPPKDKLPQAEIAALTKWVEMGAPWPQRKRNLTPMQERIEVARASHWALQPVKRPQVPKLADRWIQSPIDAFVLQRLQEAKISPSAAADKRTLIRRASYDLTGLPPTPEQVEAFLRDDSPKAFAKVIDRLLESPEYGKRWGRHWLDVARYADTRGYSLGREPRLPFAYTYRDYVVRSFNEDKPYDQFILEQLAADQLEELDDQRDLAAMGFLTVGRRFSRVHDIIDDRIDVVTRGLVGMTATCARCHDHKFDPIPTADYYSLYGVFASCEEPEELPLIEQPDDSPKYKRFFAELNKRQQALDSFIDKKRNELLDHLRSRAADYLVKVAAGEGEIPEDAAISLGKDELKPHAVKRWADYLKRRVKKDDPVFAAWARFAELKEDAFANRAAEIAKQLAGDQKINRLVREAFAQEPPKSMLEVAQTYGRLLGQIYANWKKQQDKPEKLAEADAEALRQILYADGTPTVIPQDELRRYFDRETRNKQRELKRKIVEWNAKSADAPPRAMVLVDKDHPVQPAVFIRGNPNRRGERVPRRFLQALTAEERRFQKGSGRLELARSIANRNNPLTARVFVNRVWMHHFGQGLVETPSDFGIRTGPPSHPELLDHLAWTFMEQGWSIKSLHRHMMLSATYQQASLPREDCQKVDPENRLLWRMNRRRLEFESLRDAMLFVSGRLDTTLGGRPTDFWNDPNARRNSLYGLVDRQHLASVLRVFDFASPDASTGKRPRTTVPQQALFGMNSPFVAKQAQALMQRKKISQQNDPAARIQAVYSHVLCRPATEKEVELGKQFIAAAEKSSKKSAQPPWEQYAHALLMSNEFLFID